MDSKQMLLSGLDFVDIIEKHNPFGFKDKDGTVCIFRDYSEVYLETMNRLLEQHPRGYIELALFVSENCGIPLKDAADIVKSWVRRGDIEEPLLVRWDDGDGMLCKTMRDIMVKLHNISETHFCLPMFNIAFDNFQEAHKDYSYEDWRR